MFVLPKSYKLVQLVFCPLICVHNFTHDDFLHFVFQNHVLPTFTPCPFWFAFFFFFFFFFLNKQDIKVLKIYCKQFMHLILVPVCSRVVIDLMFWQQCLYGLHQYAEHKTYACVLLCFRSRKKQLEMRQSNTSFVYISIC